MERLLPTFDVYDLLAYFVPGSFLIFSIYIILSSFNIVIEISLEGLFNFISASIVMICIIFSLGFLIQTIGSLVERKLVYNDKFYLGTIYPSVRYMLDEDTHFPIEIKTKMKKSIRETFDLSENYSVQKGFDLCYTYTIQKGIYKRVEKFLGLYAFSRGLYISSLVSSAIILLLNIMTLKSILLYLYSASFLLSAIISFYRYKNYGGSFADAVYRDFYVHRITMK